MPKPGPVFQPENGDLSHPWRLMYPLLRVLRRAKKRPRPPDPDEPRRVAKAAADLGLRYVVVTSVTRDDLADGGAAHFARTVTEIREHVPDSSVEVLVPDFQGDTRAVDTVLASGPRVFNHNVETVPRLYTRVRPEARYDRSLAVLRHAARRNSARVKSGLMVGLGETRDEVETLLRDLFSAGCTMVTIGQYLRPRRENLPVFEYIRPEQFTAYGEIARRIGFSAVASGPLVRSSMDAEDLCRV